MQQLLNNFDQTKKAIICFLQNKFSQSKLTTVDFEDATSIAFFKLILDSQKCKPTLTPSVQTIRNLAYYATIDIYRKRKREVLTDEYSLSMTDENDSCEDKHQIEVVVAEIQNLSERRKQILAEKYDMKHFSSDTSIEEIVAFKSRPRFRGFALAQKVNCPSDNAFRQELHNTVKQLRSRLLRT